MGIEHGMGIGKMKQMTLATGTGFELHRRPMRKAEFLAKMDTLGV
jgi:hypothetical protein